MSNNLKKTLKLHYMARESLAEYFQRNAGEAAIDSRKTDIGQAIEEALQAESQSKDNAARFYTLTAGSPPVPEETDTSSLKPLTEPPHLSPAQQSITVPDIEYRLFETFQYIIQSHCAVPNTSSNPDIGEFSPPIMSFNKDSKGEIEVLLLPFPYESDAEPGSPDEITPDADMYNNLKALFDDLEAAAERNNTRLVRDTDRIQFRIISDSSLDLMHLLQEYVEEQDLIVREGLSLNTLMKLEETSPEGERYFSSRQQHQNYLKERVLLDYDESQDLFASSPEYFLDGLPARIYMDFAEAARVRLNYHHIEPQLNLIHVSFTRMGDALWRQDSANADKDSGIPPLLRLH